MDPEFVEKWNGIPLIEVFSIIYLGDDEVPPEEQLGTIRCHVTRNPVDLYKVDNVDRKKPSIKFGDPIMITGAPMTKVTDLFIKFNLFCGAFKNHIEVEWEPQEDEVCVYEEKIKSNDGTSQLCVQYGLFGSATIANVSVTLLGNNDHTNVHGFVISSNSILDSCNASILFWKNPDNKSPVINGVIPLSKTSVGVPLDSEFWLAISLWCENTEYATKMTLRPLLSGSSVEKCCEDKLQVSVSWGVD